MAHMFRLAAILLIACAAVAAGSATDAQGVEFFEQQVRPVLVRSCLPCHGPAQQFSALRLDSREAILKGGNRGPALLPGNAAASLLARAIRQEDLKMPIGSRLKDAEIAAIEKWINLGAPWPRELAKSPLGPGDPGYYEKLTREHWAFQPVVDPPIPAVRNAA